jgi:hypothetical protein
MRIDHPLAHARQPFDQLFRRLPAHISRHGEQRDDDEGPQGRFRKQIASPKEGEQEQQKCEKHPNHRQVVRHQVKMDGVHGAMGLRLSPSPCHRGERRAPQIPRNPSPIVASGRTTGP